MNLTFDGKSLLISNEVAELVVEFAAALARSGGADTVRLAAYGADGESVEVLLLLGQGAPVMAESSHTEMPELDNRDIVSYMKHNLERTTTVTSGLPLDHTSDSMFGYEDDFDYPS